MNVNSWFKSLTSIQQASIAIICIVICSSAGCVYTKMSPPGDVDKTSPNNSCYLATASNMLAGAGYGTGSSIQDRANDIYQDMIAEFGVADTGWTDTALNWWLSSSHNTWTTNPYTVVTVYGSKSPKWPWADADGARFIANQLRECNFMGLSISWPTSGSSIGSGGHAITAWGDSSGDETLTVNPSSIRVTDSDTDNGGDVQSYTYDTYTNPNPGGPNEGNGWYINYDSNHPYIKHIIVLSQATTPSGGALSQKVVGSYKIHQDKESNATDLHYKVGTDVDILSYLTKIDWGLSTPAITESTPQRRQITVDWDLTEYPVPYCTWITITTEFILPSWNAIEYNDVHFTYPDGSDGKAAPSIRWEMTTPKIEKATQIPNVTGGYVVGSFDIVNPNIDANRGVVGEYRFIHEYGFNQAPDMHNLLLKGERGYYATNFGFGHSYGYLSTDSLWKFEEWMTRDDQKYAFEDKPIELRIDWTGELPYPAGEDIQGRIPEIKKELSGENQEA